jgi:hypothetical protein
MGWQDYAHAGGFVQRDRITAVGTVPRQMGEHEPTLQRQSTPTFHAFTCAFIVIPTAVMLFI